MSEISDLIAAGEQLQKQRAEAAEFHLAGQHDQSSHGAWATGITEDMSPTLKAEREAIAAGIVAERAAKGLKPLAANSLRGMAIKKHQEILKRQGREAEIATRTRTPSAPKGETSATRIQKKTAAESARIKAEQAASIEKIRAEAKAIGAERAAEKAAEAAKAQRVSGGSEVKELKKIAEEKAAEARRIAEGGGAGSVEHRTAIREATAAEVAVRSAEIAAAAYEPSDVKINERGMALPSGVRNGIQAGREAMKKAGLKGDYGTVAVEEDDGRKSRYGAYYPGLNKIVMNGRTLPNPEGDGAFTFTHEYGHHIDQFEARRVGGKNFSDQPAFKAALKKTMAYTRMVENKKALRGQGRYATDDMGRPASRLTYLLKPTELFARAFAQWAATRGGSPAMRNVLERRRGDHWSSSDFAPLMDYFDKNFGERKVRTAAGARRYGQSIGEVIAADSEE